MNVGRAAAGEKKGTGTEESPQMFLRILEKRHESGGGAKIHTMVP